MNPIDGAIPTFAKRINVVQVEEGTELALRFDSDGLIACVITDFVSGELF